jgi:hypothetical protein
MTTNSEQFRVPLDGSYVMRLRPSELEAVALGLGVFDASAQGSSLRLAAAVRSLPASDRAPLWELAVRRYGRRQPLEQAAGSIGMDRDRAEALLGALARAIAAAPPETSPNL